MPRENEATRSWRPEHALVLACRLAADRGAQGLERARRKLTGKGADLFVFNDVERGSESGPPRARVRSASESRSPGSSSSKQMRSITWSRTTISTGPSRS